MSDKIAFKKVLSKIELKKVILNHIIVNHLKEVKIESMFDDISKKYDKLNQILTFGLLYNIKDGGGELLI